MVLFKFTEDLNITFFILLLIFISFCIPQYIIRRFVLSQIREIHVTDEHFYNVNSGYKLIETVLNKYLKINVLITKKQLNFRLFNYNQKKRKLIIDSKCYFSKSITNYYKCLVIITHVYWIHQKNVCRIFSRYSFYWIHVITICLTGFLISLIFLLIKSDNGYSLNLSGQNFSYANLLWMFLLYLIVFFICDVSYKSISILCMKRLWKKISITDYFSDNEIGFLNRIANIEITTSATGPITRIGKWIQFGFHTSHLFKRKTFL